jgi:hypothetical protein
MPPNEMTIAEKRQMLLQYVAHEKNGHDYFRLNDGSHFEGYIVEVGETTIVFQWAPSLFDSADLVHEEVEIPIEEIDILSLK